MIDTISNLLFRCSHRRLTRPLSAMSKTGEPQSHPYVVCLDCGKQFTYDMKSMKMGKAVDRSHQESVLPPDLPKASSSNLKVVLLGVPLGFLLGAFVKKQPPGTG